MTPSNTLKLSDMYLLIPRPIILIIISAKNIHVNISFKFEMYSSYLESSKPSKLNIKVLLNTNNNKNVSTPLENIKFLQYLLNIIYLPLSPGIHISVVLLFKDYIILFNFTRGNYFISTKSNPDQFLLLITSSYISFFIISL